MRTAVVVGVLGLAVVLAGCSQHSISREAQQNLLASRLSVAPERLRYVGREPRLAPPHDRWKLTAEQAPSGTWIATVGAVDGEVISYQAALPEAMLPLEGAIQPAEPLDQEEAARHAKVVADALWPGRNLQVATVVTSEPPTAWGVLLHDLQPKDGMPEKIVLAVDKKTGRVAQIM